MCPPAGTPEVPPMFETREPVLTIVEVPYLGGSKWVVLNDEGRPESAHATKLTRYEAIQLAVARLNTAIRRGAR